MHADVPPLFKSSETVINTKVDAASKSTVSVTTSKLSPVAAQVYDLHLLVFQGDVDACFKRRTVGAAHARNLCVVQKNNHSFKRVRYEAVSAQRCADTMAGVP